MTPGRGTLPEGSRPALGPALGAAALLAATVLLAPAVPAQAAGHSQARNTRTAHAAPAKHAGTRHAARRTHSRRSASDAAYDDTAGATTQPVAYAPRLATGGIASPRAACLAAARHAEANHGLPQGLMVAIALSESGLHAHALNIRGRAYFPEDRETARALLARAGGVAMAGCVQVNTAANARGSDWPLDPEQATDWAGRLLARAYAETGSWTSAVARFHGGSPAGSRRVICRVRAKLEVAAPGSPALRDAACSGDTASARRNGAAHLEIAEAAE